MHTYIYLSLYIRALLEYKNMYIFLCLNKSIIVCHFYKMQSQHSIIIFSIKLPLNAISCNKQAIPDPTLSNREFHTNLHVITLICRTESPARIPAIFFA